MVATRGAIASALMVLDGGLRMALRKEGEGGKGVEKGGSKGEKVGLSSARST